MYTRKSTANYRCFKLTSMAAEREDGKLSQFETQSNLNSNKSESGCDFSPRSIPSACMACNDGPTHVVEVSGTHNLFQHLCTDFL